jgi:hypothetical protein
MLHSVKPSAPARIYIACSIAWQITSVRGNKLSQPSATVSYLYFQLIARSSESEIWIEIKFDWTGGDIAGSRGGDCPVRKEMRNMT